MISFCLVTSSSLAAAIYFQSSWKEVKYYRRKNVLQIQQSAY